ASACRCSGSPPTSVHLQSGILTQPRQRHQDVTRWQCATKLGTAILPRSPLRRNRSGNVLIAGTAPQQAGKIESFLGIEAAIPTTIGGESRAITITAEWRGG